MKQKKKPKSTLLADNTQGLITTKQTKPGPVASAAPYHITPADVRIRCCVWGGVVYLIPVTESNYCRKRSEAESGYFRTKFRDSFFSHNVYNIIPPPPAPPTLNTTFLAWLRWRNTEYPRGWGTRSNCREGGQAHGLKKSIMVSLKRIKIIKIIKTIKIIMGRGVNWKQNQLCWLTTHEGW